MPRARHLDNDEQQCRQCSSFADYVKENRKKLGKDGKDTTDSDQEVCTSDDALKKAQRTDCPLDRDELGNKSWGLLHTMAAKYPKEPTSQDKKDMNSFFCLFSKLYPCDHCADELKEDLKKHPPQVQSQNALSQWLCEVHNRVNVRVGKPRFDCTKVHERWRDGWKDGSCDL